MIQRAIISGGGTGGPIFPAVSIAEALRRRYPEIDILFIGAEGRMEMERVPQAGFPIRGLKIRGLDRKRPWRNIGVIRDFLRALITARDIIRDFRPEIVIGVGGYASAPTLKAAQSLGIPTLIQEQNSYAGVTNKFLARRADRICVAYPEMERFFPKDKIVLTGNPLRPAIEYMQDGLREEALRHFGLPADTKRVGVVIAAVYMLLPYQRVFTGAPAPERVGSPDLDGRERLVVVPIIAAMLALGLAPGVLTSAFDDVARQVALTVTTSSQAETSARGAGDSPDAGGATDAPAASTATEGNTK